jgi:hypothetical protein
MGKKYAVMRNENCIKLQQRIAALILAFGCCVDTLATRCHTAVAKFTESTDELIV